jgi:hypothetical protein
VNDFIYLVGLVAIVVLAIWLAVVIVKWLFVIAIAAALIWLVLFFTRRSRA